jgi:hypothetical protein
MIKRLIKIIYIKITKPAPRLRRSGTGTEPHTYARSTDENSTELSALAPVTMNPDRVRELYERGLILMAELPGMADVVRMAALHQDREQREQEARTDASRCPCAGRHYPSTGGCRWCTCHRPPETIRTDMSVPPYPVTDDQVRETLMAVRRSDEIQSCGACGHPHHGVNGAGCPRSVPSGEPSGGIEACRCDGTRIREYSITDEAVDAAWDSFLGINPDGVEGGPS